MKQICLLTGAAGLDAAAGAAFARVFKGLAYAHLLLNDHVGVEHRGIAHAVAEYSGRGAQHVVRRALADLNVALRLEKAQFVKYLQADVGDFAGTVGAVSFESRKVDVCKIVVCAALLRRDADLRRRGGVVDFDPEAGEKLLRLVARERAVGDALRVEGGEVLVKMSGAHGVPAVQLGYRSEVNEPVHLHRLPEVAGGVRGNVTADFGYLKKFGPASLVLLLRRHLFGKLRVTLGEDDHRVAGDRHSLELFVFRGGVGVVDEVQLRAGGFDIFFKVEGALLIDKVVKGGVSEGALFAEFGEGAGLIEQCPVFGHALEEAVSHAAAAPVGLDDLLVGVHILGRHGVVLLGARREDLKVLP